MDYAIKPGTATRAEKNEPDREERLEQIMGALFGYSMDGEEPEMPEDLLLQAAMSMQGTGGEEQGGTEYADILRVLEAMALGLSTGWGNVSPKYV